MKKTLKELRIEKNLTQEDMAEVLGKSLPSYNKKENGIIKISIVEAQKIAKFFKIKIDDIFLS